MDNQVRYTVTAQDMISGKLQGMNDQAVKLESTMGGLSKIMGTLGIGFGVFKGLEFIKGGIEKVEKLNQATAQVKAGLESTGGAAGMTMDSISEMADKMSSRMLFGKADILDMQAQMLTFGGITKENFPAIGDAIANVASKIGMDLHGMAIQFGKAMDNPSDGIKKLSRQGVIFSKEQTDAIDKLVEKGKIVEAQQIMLTEIQNKYGGSSKAAFDANPLAVFTKRMGNFQVSIGKVAIEFMEKLVPTLNYIADLFKSLGKFMKEHADIILYVVGVYVIYKGIILAQVAIEKISIWWKGVSATATLLLTGYEMARAEGMGVLTAAQWALNVAMDANPIGLMIVGIAAAIALVAEIVVHFNDWGAALSLLLGPIGLVIGAIMSIYNHWQSIKDAFNTGGFTAGIKRIGVVLFDSILYPLQQAMHWIGKITGAQWAKDGANQLMGFRKSLNLVTDEETKNKGTKPAIKEVANKDKNKFNGALPKAPIGAKPIKGTAGVQSNKPVTVNITIGSLVHDFKISTTNLKESTTAIRDEVVKTLMSAVNDSQLIAGQ
jgi:hypothetical protein